MILMRSWYTRFLFSAIASLAGATLGAAELTTLRPETWDEYAPRGKEVDCIYGDYVLRNDRIVAVVAQPIAGRNANMTVRNVGGCVIDLTRTDRQSDQLSAYYPGGTNMSWRRPATGADAEQGAGEPDPAKTVVRGDAVVLRLVSQAGNGQPAAELRYTLADGCDFILVETVYSNPGDMPLEILLIDQMRADGSFEKVPNGKAELFWVYDKWFDQAYGITSANNPVQCLSDARDSTVRFEHDGKTSVVLEPGGKLQLARRLFAAANLLELKANVQRQSGYELSPVVLEIRDTAGGPVAEADVVVEQGGVLYGAGRTDAEGRLKFDLPEGEFQATVSVPPCGTQSFALRGDTRRVVELPQAGYIVAEISDERGGPIPCKVQFRGRGDTPDPVLGHDTSIRGVRNVYYSENGRFRLPLAPGKYEAIVSHGPEHDAVFAEIELTRGKETPLAAVLVRSVQTPGWVSADFHSHASPSGDNTSSQLGRVLNLLCEQIDFAPCTEHNRLSTYEPHLERLGAKRLMATCTGIELTDQPGDVNHHNAFPLVRNPRTQDDGAPLSDADMELKVERLALWDGGSEKLVQQNHPDIGHVFFDKNGDGSPDSGFQKAFPFLDVIEVHPPHFIFQPPTITSGGKTYNNTVFNWLQLLNQGFRIPGVVNTDAHYNFHGSGFLRVYLQSPTDDPAEIATLDMVHAAERGHVIMTSGPFLEVVLTSDTAGEHSRGTAGDDVAAPGGKASLQVRVQCPNWFDIDRVQVFLNGAPSPELNFTRAATPERFTGGTVKFEQMLPLELAADTHVIIVAAGEHSTLGPVMGPDHGKDMPIVISNPIFVDVDGGGFRPNGDTLGAPLPVTSGRRAK